MDSTIVTAETLDELADFAGLKDQIAAITRRAMNGELDFEAALRERVGDAAGPRSRRAGEDLGGDRLTPGARELVATMRAHGALRGLVSGGFTFFTGRVAALAGFTCTTPTLLMDDGAMLTGRVAEPILDRDAKVATAARTGRPSRHLPLAATLAVGDGANDLDMIRAARARRRVPREARRGRRPRARVDHADLRALLFAQGFSASEESALRPGNDLIEPRTLPLSKGLPQ